MAASGACRHALLLAGDVASPPRDKHNRITAPIFGDGGSATLVSYAPGSAPLTFSLHTDGRGYSHIISPAGGARLPFVHTEKENSPLLEDIIDSNGNPWRLNGIFMDGKAIFDFTMHVVPDHITKFLSKCALSPEKLDYVFLHQANKQIVNVIAEKIHIPAEKAPFGTFSRYGNLSSASIPAALCDQFGAAGDTGSKAMLLCGFGVGLSWGSCLWLPQQCRCSDVITVPSKPVSRESKIQFWRHHLSGGKN